MKHTWRLLDTPPMTAAENMAFDDTLLELKGRGEAPDTLRFLRFSPRAVLVGFHQSVEEEIRTEYCREHGIDINRRITGGGAIFFDESQLGWEVICDKTFFDLPVPNERLFRNLCAPVIQALSTFGLAAEFRPRNDIEIRGRKISGTGGTESEGAFLFQGTMLTDFDVDTMLRALRIPIEKLKHKEIDSLKERVTCLRWELGHTPSMDELKAAIRAGFEGHLGIRLEPGGLTPREERLFAAKVDRYRSNRWVDGVRPQTRHREAVQAAFKTVAGLVRFTLAVNLPQGRLKDVYITGDFLSFPPRALYDLEAALRGRRLNREELHRQVRSFFEEGRITIPGLEAAEFLKPLDQALEKLAIAGYGIPLELCNLISVTNGSFRDVLEKGPSVLLLPYCSKLTTCEWRYEKGCEQCGGCSIGQAWTLADERRLEGICITSFEDLTAELGEMKERGVQAFIGCCCQPFYVKHAEDFEKAGIPGILLDIENTTCYDLDRAREAYAGRFESQTHVNLALLESVLNAKVI